MASSTWIGRCEERAHQACFKLATELPKKLATTARSVGSAEKSWEWKHFWVENAYLWQRQDKRTQNLQGDWGPIHDQVFEDWNKSEHAEQFLTALNKGMPLKLASQKTLKTLEAQLHQLAIRHFGAKGAHRESYKKQFELGEFPGAAYSQNISLGLGHEIEFYSWDKKSFTTQLERITQALDLVKTYSPDSYVLFQRFTKRIVPIKQKEFVSYSLQSLPGHSFINLYDRDDLDLMDDLLHENGHHHLNHYLILESPLREDPDQIYYSPWRRSLRPVRGIYHAHLTFFFALKLYHDLCLALIEERLDWPRPLTAKEKEKIFFRYAEEWIMLEYTALDLKRAIEFGQVLPAGVKLLKEMEVDRKKLGSLFAKVFKQMSASQRKKIQELQATLKEQAQLTRE